MGAGSSMNLSVRDGHPRRDRLDMAGLGFERVEAAETGRPGYDPRDLLKLICMGTCSRSVPRGDWNRSADATLS
jgi:hypothetical protein